MVPTEAFKTGVFNFTYIDPNTLGTTTVPVDLTPVQFQQRLWIAHWIRPMQKILALYPNAPQSADGVSGVIHYPSSSRTSCYQTVAKIDHHFTDRETLSVRYGYGHQTDPNPFHDDILPGNIGATSTKSISQGLSANLVSSLNSNLLNSFNFGWNRIYANFNCTGLDKLDSVSQLDQFGNGVDYAMDPFTSFGCLSLTSDGQFRTTGTTSYTDTLSWVHGAHTFKFGGDFRDVHETRAQQLRLAAPARPQYLRAVWRSVHCRVQSDRYPGRDGPAKYRLCRVGCGQCALRFRGYGLQRGDFSTRVGPGCQRTTSSSGNTSTTVLCRTRGKCGAILP